MLSITTVICTRNRADPLRRVLDSLCAARQPKDALWELVIVDNGSTDDTEAVVAAYADRLRVRRIVEERPGLSFARNAGVAAARGDYILWTDDDVTVDPGWLEAYARAIRAAPDASVYGGVVRPVLEAPTPAWLSANRAVLRHLRAEVPPRNGPIAAGDADLPYGANFAVNTRAQQAHLYDVELGASPVFNRLGEEELVIRAVLESSGPGVWVPDAVVEHHIPAARQTLGYVEKYNRASGETWALLQVRAGALDPAAPPRWLARNILRDTALYRLARMFGRSSSWLPRLASIAYCRGALDYLRAQARAG